MKILVINAGSSSLKYQLIDTETGKYIAKGICERIGIDGMISGKTSDGRQYYKETDLANHTIAFRQVKRALLEGDCKVLDSLDEITAVGHRVVQGGALFNHSCLITPDVLEGIRSLSDLAPLHNPAHIEGIQACQEVFGDNVPQVAVFDNAFHSTMPPEAYLFPIPYEYYEKYKIRRYGFHGTSHKFVMQRCAQVMGRDLKGLKLITCHLGNGSSITAIKGGRVVDTSMGLTPLDGFMMGTRTGSLDPSVVTFLQEKEGWTPQQTDEIFNKKSGVLGISGVSSDDRDIDEAEDAGNKRAILAHTMQVYEIRKFIGSYVAAMDGVDAIVFTGGLGENATRLRGYICEHLSYLGVDYDREKNKELCKGKEGELSKPGSKVHVFVLCTNEELMIAQETQEIVESL